MLTASFAVQPKSFGGFDQWGCLWADNLEHAYKIAGSEAAGSLEAQVIWRCPNSSADPIPWATVTY